MSAKIKLTNYITKVRTYAAQLSFPISNLYYSYSKRLAQPPISGTGPVSSQALDEFIMATWRLYNPQTSSSGGKKLWINQIQHGSAASIQKEMVILLSEINYQLYLNRQIQERILLAQSMNLIQNSLMSQPDTSMLSVPNTSSSSTNSSSTP